MHDEWVKQYASSYYVQPQPQPQQPVHFNQYPPYHQQQQPMQYGQGQRYVANTHYSNPYQPDLSNTQQINSVAATNPNFVSLEQADRRSLIPLTRENKAKSTLPLNIGLVGKQKTNKIIEVSSKSPRSNKSSNKSHRSSKSKNSHKSSSHSAGKQSRSRSSILVNASMPAAVINRIARLSVDQKKQTSDEEDDGFEILETQWTGRSNTTQTKDEKERHNSGSTSKGLSQLTERDLPSMTSQNRRQTTPRSYTIDNQLFKNSHTAEHPFIKNSSAHSNQSMTQQTVSSDLFASNNKSKTINQNEASLAIMEEDVNQNDV